MFSIIAHPPVELLLARVAERRMADVVDQSESLGKISIEFEGAGNGTRDLRDFERVREAIAKVVRVPSGKNLRLGFQPPERPGMNYAIAVAGIIVSIRVLWFRVAPAARALHVHSVGCEHFRPI